MVSTDKASPGWCVPVFEGSPVEAVSSTVGTSLLPPASPLRGAALLEHSSEQLITNFIFTKGPYRTDFHVAGIRMSRVIFCQSSGLPCVCFRFLVI